MGVVNIHATRFAKTLYLHIQFFDITAIYNEGINYVFSLLYTVDITLHDMIHSINTYIPYSVSRQLSDCI